MFIFNQTGLYSCIVITKRECLIGLYKSKNLTAARRTADLWFGKFVRLRDSDENGFVTCCTCGEVLPYDEGVVDCSHWIEASVETTRYNEFNAHAGCKRCNMSDNGMAAFHGKYIQVQHGKDIYEELLTLARETITFDSPQDRIEWYMEWGRHYKQQYEEILEARNG